MSPARAARPAASSGRNARRPHAAASVTPVSTASSDGTSIRPPAVAKAARTCDAARPASDDDRNHGPPAARIARAIAEDRRMSMPVSTWVEVDLDRFGANLRALQAFVGGECGLFLVVKADAYGHGAVEIAEAAAEEGVRVLGIATLH